MAKQEKLEKVLEYLVNKDEAKAKALLHNIFVETAREIHESLMQEDEFDPESVDGDKEEIENEEMAFEEFFAEDDLVGDDDDMGEEADESMDGEGEEAGEELADEMVADDEAQVAADMGEEEGDIESQIDDLQAKFDELQAELEALKSDEGDEVAADDAEMAADDAEMSADDAEMAADDAEDNAEEAEDDDVFEELDALLSQDYDDLAESIELEKVSTSMSETGGVGAGEKITPNKNSPVVSHGVKDRVKQATPVKIKSVDHNGFAMETAPTSKVGTGAKSPRNSNSDMNAGRTKVSKEGDASATLNSNKGFGDGNDKSPLSDMNESRKVSGGKKVLTNKRVK